MRFWPAPVLTLVLLLAFIPISTAADTAGPVADSGNSIGPAASDLTIHEFQYDNDVKPRGYYGLRPRGHAVLFKNKNTTIILKGVRIYGCRYGDLNGVVNVSVYNSDVREIYRDSIPYGQLKFDEVKTAKTFGCDYGSWVDIPLPDHEVTGDFYVGIFTESYSPSEDKRSIYIGYITPSQTHTSFILTYPKMRIESGATITGSGFPVSNIDWLIRARYARAPPRTPEPTTMATPETTMPRTPVIAATPEEPVRTPVPAASESPPAKSPAEIILAGLSLPAAACLMKRLK